MLRERLSRPDGEGRRPLQTRAAELGDVVTSALDHTSELVRDAVALGVLEAKGAARELAPRVAWALVATAAAIAGSVIAIVAGYLGLGYVIASAAIRLAIVAGALFVVAAFALGMASRRSRPGRPAVVDEAVRAERPLLEERPVHSVAPMHPADGVGR